MSKLPQPEHFVQHHSAKNVTKNREIAELNSNRGDADGDKRQILISRKGAVSKNEGKDSNLRNIIEQKQEYFKQSKPFNKKFTTNKQRRHESENNQVSQNSNNHIVKSTTPNSLKKGLYKKSEGNDEPIKTPPSSKNSFRIKKIIERFGGNSAISPKKLRQQLISLNELQRNAQRQILEVHNKYKNQLMKMQQKYHLDFTSGKHMSQNKQTQGSKQGQNESFDNIESKAYSIIAKIDEKLKSKAKEIQKISHKIEKNAYIIFIKSPPEQIAEMNQSEEEDGDIVEELPPQQFKAFIENQRNTYSNMMKDIKNKSYGLNLRRTYDVFKGEGNPDKKQQQKLSQNQQLQKSPGKQDHENVITVNNKLRDLLLN